MTHHEKFMRDVFGRPASETRKALAELKQAELSAQDQQNPPAIQGDVLPGQGSSCPLSGGPGPTVSQIFTLEEAITSIAQAVKRFPRSGWSEIQRDYLGTLWMNVSSAVRHLARLEIELQAHLDATRK